MGRGHGDRLSATDSTFLRLESETEQMHTATLFVFGRPDAADFSFSRFLKLVASRLHLVPRFRQKLAHPPAGLANPIWVDDGQFDLSYHVRHSALPQPGRVDQLMEYVARLVSRPLDRQRPLWELYVIEGLEEDRVAYVGKTHHALVNGITGVDVATLLLDYERDPGPIPPPKPWHASDPPGELAMAVSALRAQARSPRDVWQRARELTEAPRSAASKAVRVTRGLASMASFVGPGPRSPLNTVNGAYRRLAIQRLELERAKAVKDAFDTTVNDVILAVVGDALGRFLRARGQDTGDMRMKVMVPISVRGDEERSVFGNRVSSVYVPLPVDEIDPVRRLIEVAESMRDITGQEQVVGAEFLVGMSAYAPSTIHALASRLAARARLYNFVLTNVPGPQVALWSLGMRLMGAFPISPLPENHSFACGVTSIDGWLNFGFTGDFDSMPDLENIPRLLEEALNELVTHAEASDTRHELARPSEQPPGSR